MSTIPIGSTDKARTAQAVIIVDRATGEPAAAGGGAGTSDTTEATQLLVKTAVQATAANSATALTKLDTLHTDLTTAATELPKTPLMATSDLTYVFDSSSASTERSLVTATASQTTKGYAMVVSAAGATTVTFTDGSAGAVLYTLEFPAAGAYVLDPVERPYFKTSANTVLYGKSSNAVKTTIGLRYVKGA